MNQHQPGKVVNPARGPLDRKMNIPENLVYFSIYLGIQYLYVFQYLSRNTVHDAATININNHGMMRDCQIMWR